MQLKSAQALIDRVAQFISDPKSDSFEEIALDLFSFQFSKNIPYQKYCQALGKTPDHIAQWQKIPAIPTHSFKHSQFPLRCFPESSVTFLTSGTTSESKGVHYFPTTSLYELSITQGWQDAKLPHLSPLFLAPSPRENPNSSLSYMFGHLAKGDDSAFLLCDQKFQLAALFEKIREGGPFFLMGTALAFLHLTEVHRPLSLPKGSLILETGGYKGTHRELSKGDFYQQLSEFFDLPTTQIYNEYGMTELSSQAYALGPTGNHRFPPWSALQVIDPESGLPLPPGEIGYLQLLDLANVFSVASIRTQDFAIHHADGTFSLIGRDPGALPRGCSRTIDHAFSS